jgi:Cu-Zn family superoxide dismutase
LKKTILIAVMIIALLLSPFASAQSAAITSATAKLKDANGHDIGLARFTQDADGKVNLNVQVKGLSPGLHGIHIHQYGTCSPSFAAAGEHYNPLGKHHGLDNPNGPHAGDLPNLVVNKDGSGKLITTTDRVTLTPGQTSLFNGNGTSLIIHAKPDDQKTDPAGNSGDRIACGVITANS